MKNYIILFIIVTEVVLPLEATPSYGTVQGKVSEDPGSRIIPGVLVTIMDTGFHTLSNEKGEYKFNSVPVGNYRIKFSAAGFGTIVEADVIVHPDRVTFLDVKMKEQLPHLEETVTVKESYFRKNEAVLTGSVNISAEEVRRTPGSAGFIDRMLPVLPGVGQKRDGGTDLMVRGGCPTENGLFIDNIEVPYISHVPRLGSTGGLYSAIHPDLIQSVDFYSSAFSSNFGGRLSSITDITFREGNRTEFDGQVESNLVLAGTLMEGPIMNGKGSWLIAARKSYIKLLRDLGILDDDDAPIDTNDILVKLTYDLSAKHKISFLNFTTYGSFQDNHDYSVEVKKYLQNTIGCNLKSFWNDSFFSNTTLSYSFLKREDKETYNTYYWEAPDITKYFILRNSNHIIFKNQNRLKFGMEIKHERDDINYYSHEYYDSEGEYYPSWERDFGYYTTKSALFFSYISKFFNRFTTTIGLRGDYSSTHKVFHLSPRFSFSFRINKRLSITGGYGIFYQTIPIRWMTIYPGHRDLDDLKATHYSLGFEYINSGTKITLEAYSKEYKNLLIDTRYPYALASEFDIDKFYYPSSLINNSKGYARGIELLVHKKLVKHFYGIFNTSIYRSRYKDLYGIWRRSPYENRYIVNLVAGYRPNAKWEFGLTWTIMGGRPSTPFDLEASRLYNQTINVSDLSKYNTENYPSYNRLNLRGERRFYLGKTSLIVYMDIWNILNSKNYEYYWWDPGIGDVVPGDEQMPIMPILGLKFKF